MQSLPSTAAQIIVTIIPVVGIIAGCSVIFFYLLYNHTEKMLMIEKGLTKKNVFDIEMFSLFTGLLLIGFGLSLTIFFHVKEGMSYSALSGIIPLSCGMSLILFFIIRDKMIKKSNDL